GASDSEINGLYRKWDAAIMQASSGELIYGAKNVRRNAEGHLVLYRGGDFGNVKPNEYKLDANGNVKTGPNGGRGPSLFDDPAKIPPRFTEINRVKLLPPELTTKPWGQQGHFEVVPREPMSVPRFFQLLREIVTEAVKEPKE